MIGVVPSQRAVADRLTCCASASLLGAKRFVVLLVLVFGCIESHSALAYCPPGPYQSTCLYQEQQQQNFQREQQMRAQQEEIQRQNQMRAQQQENERQNQMRAQQQENERQNQMRAQQQENQRQNQMRAQQQENQRQQQQQPQRQPQQGQVNPQHDRTPPAQQPNQAQTGRVPSGQLPAQRSNPVQQGPFRAPPVAPVATGQHPIRDPRAGSYVYQGQSHPRLRVARYHWPGGMHYQRYGIGAHLPRAFINALYQIADAIDYGLTMPPYGYEWIRYGADALEIDDDTGEIVDATYGAFVEDASLDDAGAGGSQAAAPAQSVTYWAMGLAWNSRGGYAAAFARTLPEAQQTALNNCNQGSGGECFDSGQAIQPGSLGCLSIVLDANSMPYAVVRPDSNAASLQALEFCSGRGASGCHVAYAGCNQGR